jgi:hypothetical protein
MMMSGEFPTIWERLKISNRITGQRLIDYVW